MARVARAGVSRSELATEPPQVFYRQTERARRLALFEPGGARVRGVHEQAERRFVRRAEPQRDTGSRLSAPNVQNLIDSVAPGRLNTSVCPSIAPSMANPMPPPTIASGAPKKTYASGLDPPPSLVL